MKHFIIFIVTCLLSQGAWAGWVVTYKDAETGKRSQEFYQGGKADFGQMIYTGKHFLAVDQGSKAYWKGTPEQYCKALGAQLQEMEAMIASMPAEYRPKPISQQKVTRKKLGTKSIAGFTATGYNFSVDGVREGGIWVSSDSGLSGIIDFESSASKKMKCLDDLNNTSLEGAALYKKITEGAFILRESYREVVSVERKKVPASKFNTPAGYKKFTDFQKYKDHIANNSSSSSGPSSAAFQDDNFDEGSQYQQQQEKSAIVKDIDRGAVNEADQSTNQDSLDGVPEDIQKGVKGFLDAFF